MRQIIIGFLVFAACSASAQTAFVAKVTGDRVNLRGRPESNGEIVGKANYGDVLAVREIGETWVSVAPPAGVKAWIHKEFVTEGRVATKELNVRAGPGVNYPRIGSMRRGEEIQTIETFNEWIAVPPPSNAAVWVSRQWLELSGASGEPLPAPTTSVEQVVAPATNAPAATPADVPPAEPPAATNATPVVTDAPADLNLAQRDGQGEKVTIEGFLKPAPAAVNPPGRFRLVRKGGGTIETLCFLRGNNSQLSGLTDGYFAIEGRRYWLQGVRDPLLVVELITRKSPPGARELTAAEDALVPLPPAEQPPKPPEPQQ